MKQSEVVSALQICTISGLSAINICAKVGCDYRSLFHVGIYAFFNATSVGFHFNYIVVLFRQNFWNLFQKSHVMP